MDAIATGPGGADYYATSLGLLYDIDRALITPWLEKATSDSIYLAADWAEYDGYLLLRSAFTTNGDDAARASPMPIARGFVSRCQWAVPPSPPGAQCRRACCAMAFLCRLSNWSTCIPDTASLHLAYEPQIQIR